MDSTSADNIVPCCSASTVSNTELIQEISELVNVENHFIESQLIITPSTIEILDGFDVATYLECTKGRIVKSFYENHGSLGHKQQTDLSNIIIEKEFDHTGNYKITSDRLQALSKQINYIFKTENENIYFIPYNRLTKQLSSGKLYSAYNKLRAKIKKSSTSLNNINVVSSTENIYQNSIEFLKKNLEPYDEVLRHWTITSSFRLEELKKRPELTISEYFKEFPALKCSDLLHELIKIDFNSTYTDKSNKLYDDWPIINKILIEIFKSNKPNNLQIIEQHILGTSNELTGFFLLPLLINSNFGRKRVNNGSFKLTKTEIADQFIIKATDITHMHTKIREVKLKIQSLKQTLQPLPVILGERDPVGYIYINEELYLIGSPIKAIDITFKIFQVTNLKYPTGAESIWVFIQQCLYDIKTNWDKNFISVNNLISLVHARQIQNL